MSQYSDQDIALLRTIAERIDESSVTGSETNPSAAPLVLPVEGATSERHPPHYPTYPYGGRPEGLHHPADLAPELRKHSLLERDHLRHRARQAAAIVLLAFVAAGAYALVSSKIGLRPWNDNLTKRNPAAVPPASDPTGGFSVAHAIIAEHVDQDGQPQNVTTSFNGRTPVAVLFRTEGGKPGTDVVVTSISGANLEQSCEPTIVRHPDATYWCQWQAIDPGNYTITIRLNNAIVHQVSFSAADPLEATPRRAPRPDIKSAFECVRPEGAIERAICENDSLAKLEARMDALYGSAAEGTDQAGRVRLRQQQNAFASERRLKCSEATAAELAACLISATQERILELEATRLPSFPASTSFADARRQLVAVGWRPITVTAAAPCKPGELNCRGGVEMVVCSAGSPAICRHTWMRHGTIIEITTTSGEKSQVRSIVCRAGCQ